GGRLCVHDCPQLPNRMMPLTPRLHRKSTRNRNSETVTTMMNTITEVIQVSLREVQVTLRASARTSAMNCGRLVRFFGAGASTEAVGATAALAAGLAAGAVLVFCAVGRAPGVLAIGGSETLCRRPER